MNKKVGYGIALVLALAAPLVLYPVFLMKLLCFALFACAFNLLIGYTGLLSFGHAAFFGWAAYLAGYTLATLGWPTELGLLAGTALGALIGLGMGLLAIRRQGIYFTMITLALAQMLYFVALQAPFTGGEDGLQGVPRGRLFGVVDLGHDLTLYYLVLAICVAGFALIVRTVHSPFGQVLKAIKENEPRAISLGYHVDRYKLLAFVLSAALSGLAGATKTLVLGFATLTDVHWAMSGMVVLMTLVGGMGTLAGPIVGAIIIIALENRLGNVGDFLASATSIDWFRQIGQSVTMVIGAIFIVCVLA
ncbi:MAG TPA: branched-chain amino acid ABC transporter permease, partial [Burkholderiaceae bacterium]|nr:branched-chain amino acid ABC transporter permease [Burkholderiaceae bacterium]